MSNKTQLQTNNNKLDTLITRVNAAKEVAASLPEAGSGGSGNIETCTVVIQKDANVGSISDGYFNVVFQYLAADGSIKEGMYVYVTDGNGFDAITGDALGGLPLTINNVICNRIMAFYANQINEDNGYDWLHENKVELDTMTYSAFVIIPTNANSTETVTITMLE